MTGLVQLIGQKIQTKEDGITDTASISLEKDEIIGLYFSAHWCPPCRGFTPRLANFYKNINKSKRRMRIVFVSSDRDEKSFDEYYNEMPWDALPYSERTTKKTLSKKCKVSGIPTLALFDSNGNPLKTDGDVRTLVDGDIEGKKFPWPAKPISEVLKGKLVDKDGNESTFEDLKGFTLGLYFSAHWCPPCRGFTPDLAKTYGKVKEKGHKFEIVFASSDKSEDDFKEYLGTMPWKALPFGDDRKKSLSQKFQVQGIPTLVILDSELNVITADGRSAVSADNDGNEFPWHPKPVNPISAVADSLNELPVVIHFTDGTDEEVAENGRKYLLPVAEKLGQAALPGENAEILFSAAGGDNDEDLCNRIRRFAKLPKADVKPNLLIILNLPDENIYMHEGEIESSDDVQKVVDDFKAEKLQFRDI